MRIIDFPVEFKKDWSSIELEGVIAIIKKYSYVEGYIYGDIDSATYTDSTSYAMLSYVSLTLAHDDFEEPIAITHVAISVNNMLILVCEDLDGNNVFVELESSDYIF